MVCVVSGDRVALCPESFDEGVLGPSLKRECAALDALDQTRARNFS